MKKLSIIMLSLICMPLFGMDVVLPQDPGITKTEPMNFPLPWQLDFQELLVKQITKTLHHDEWRPIDLARQIDKRTSDLNDIQERFSPKEHRMFDPKVHALRVLLKQQYYLLVSYLRGGIALLHKAAVQYQGATAEEKAEMRVGLVRLYDEVKEIYNALSTINKEDYLALEQAQIEAERRRLGIE